MITWLATKFAAVDQVAEDVLLGGPPRKKWIVKEVLREHGQARMLMLYSCSGITLRPPEDAEAFADKLRGTILPVGL